jgi:spermidine synthase
VLFSRLGTFLSTLLFLAVALSAVFMAKRLPGRKLLLKWSLMLLPLIIFAIGVPYEKTLDRRLEALRLQNYVLTDFADSPYGRIDAVSRAEQRTLFVNSVPIATSPHLAAAEELVHFPLLLCPAPESALFLGGIMGDLPGEIAKYHLKRVDSVILDEKVAALAKAANLARTSSVSKEFVGDERAFLSREQSRYDVIILTVGEPITLQLNRYYTEEFFIIARSRLAPKGILAMSFPGSENYYLPPQESFLACMYKTLKAVFPNVLFLPGETCHFIACKDSSSAYTPQDVIERLEAGDLEVKYITPVTLSFRFSPMRLEMSKDIVHPPRGIRINSDFSFAGYLYDEICWNNRLGFKAASRILPLVGKSGQVFLFCILAAFLLYALFMLLLPQELNKKVAVSSILIAGFSGMGGSIAILMTFQILCGALYQWIAILTGAFMLGAGLGSATGRAAHAPPFGTASGGYVQALVRRLAQEGGGSLDRASTAILSLVHMLLVAIFLFLVSNVLFFRGQVMSFWIIEVLFMAMQGFLGFLTGVAFVTACQLMGEGKEVAPLIYAFDLIGAFLGASLFAGVMLPLLGLPLTAVFLAGINTYPALGVFVAGMRKA